MGGCFDSSILVSNQIKPNTIIIVNKNLINIIIIIIIVVEVILLTIILVETCFFCIECDWRRSAGSIEKIIIIIIISRG